MATPSQRYFSPTHTMSGSGIPVARPIATYSPNPVPTAYSGRTNYPTNSHVDSRESPTVRDPPLGAYRFIETAGAAHYRPVHVPGEDHRPATQRAPLPDIPMDENGVYQLHSSSVGSRDQQHPHFTTSSHELGSVKPARFVTEEFRYFPRAHTFTNQFSGSGNYKSFGLATAKDEVRVHRVDYFSTP